MQIGMFSLLGIVFLVLKLTHFIDWPWVWVLAPFWIGLILAVLLIILVVLAEHYSDPLRKYREKKK